MEPDKIESEQKEPFHKKLKTYYQRFPILINLFLIGCAGCIVLLFLLWFMDFWTNHGEEEIVPDVKGMYIDQAAERLAGERLSFTVADSIYDTTRIAGTVVEQNPHPSSRVKRGRSVYLTIVAFNPKMISFPDVVNSSSRQAQSILNGIGIKNIIIKYEPSEFPDLVLGAKTGNKLLKVGDKIPVNAKITLLVGQGGTIDSDNYGGHVSVEDVEDEIWKEDGHPEVPTINSTKDPDTHSNPAPQIEPEPEPEVPFFDE